MNSSYQSPSKHLTIRGITQEWSRSVKNEYYFWKAHGKPFRKNIFEIRGEGGPCWTVPFSHWLNSSFLFPTYFYDLIRQMLISPESASVKDPIKLLLFLSFTPHLRTFSCLFSCSTIQPIYLFRQVNPDYPCQNAFYCKWNGLALKTCF